MIIGFTGAKSSGKDYCAHTLFDIIKGDYNSLTKKSLKGLGVWGVYALASPLKNFIVEVCNLSPSSYEGYLKETPIKFIKPTFNQILVSCVHFFGNETPATHIDRYFNEIISYNCNEMCQASYRTLAQHIGTDIIRDKVSHDFWLNVAKLQQGNLIISDVRFENEAEFVRDNGYLIHVKNPNVPFTNEHCSECGVKYKQGDYEIQNIINNGVYDNTHSKLREIYNNILPNV